MYERLFQLQEEVLKTLANQKRLEILQLLNKRELTVSEMVEMLGISQSNLSQHLRIMRRLKLVSTRKDGLFVYYRITDHRVGMLIKDLREFLMAQYSADPNVAEIAKLDDADIYPLAKDAVCGMRMSPDDIGATLVVSGDRYYFCAHGCYEKFKSNPSAYKTKQEVK